jgi:hypothetical protein
MFTCKDSVHLLMDFLDGDMAEEDQRHLREHLMGCPPCIDFLKTYKATPGLCRRALVKTMPEELSSKLTEFLREKMKKQP